MKCLVCKREMELVLSERVEYPGLLLLQKTWFCKPCNLRLKEEE